MGMWHSDELLLGFVVLWRACFLLLLNMRRVHLDVRVLGLPNGVRLYKAQKMVTYGGGRGGDTSWPPWGHLNGVLSTNEFTMPTSQIR